MSKARAVNEFLGSGGSGLASLVAKARRIQKLDAKLAAVLQPELAEKVRVAGLDQGQLKLVTPSAAIASRLRMDEPELLRALQAHGCLGIEKLITIIAPVPDTSPLPRRKRKLSPSAREALSVMRGEKE